MRKLGIKKYKKYQETDINFKFEPLDINNFVSASDNLGSNSQRYVQKSEDAYKYEEEVFKANHITLPDGKVIKKSDPGTITASPEEPSVTDKVLNTLANPVAAFGYSARNKDIPFGNISSDENPFDMALGLINPFKWYESGEASVESFKEGDLVGGGLNLLGALPVVPSAVSSLKHLKNTPRFKTFQNTKALKTELKGYNNDKLFNSIATNPNGQLSNKQINILAKNENLANTVVQSAIKNSDKVTAYRGVDVNAALNNSTAIKGMLKNNVNIKNHKEVADWLTTRVHTGGPNGVGYRAGGGGSELFTAGDFAYTLPRKDLITRNIVKGNNTHKVVFNTGQTAVNSQAMNYGPWVNKLKIKGTDDLTDFSMGGRKEWVSKLGEYEPMKVKIKQWSMSKDGPSYNSKVDNIITQSGETIDPMKNFFTVDKAGNFNVPVLREGGASNMFFGGRGQQIFEGSGSKFMPNRIGTGPKSIHKEGGYISKYEL